MTKRQSIDYAALEKLEKPLHKSWTWDEAAGVWLKLCTAKWHVGERTLPLSAFNKNKAARDGLHCGCRTCYSTAYWKSTPAVQKFDGDLTAYAKSTPAVQKFGGDLTARIKASPAVQKFGGNLTAYAKSTPSRQKFGGDSTAYLKSTPCVQEFDGDYGAYMNAQAMWAGYRNYYDRYRESSLKRHEARANAPFQDDFAAALRDDRGAFKQLFGDRCPVCGNANDFSHDHLVPITLGGVHHALNSLHVCRSCNVSKSNLDPLTWLVARKLNGALRAYVEERLVALFLADGLPEMHEAAFAALDPKYHEGAAAWLATWAGFVEAALSEPVTD